MIDHPLRFRPIFKHYLWGGVRLRDLLGKDCGSQPTAESWELVDHRDGQSTVAAGPWQGLTLGDLLARFGEAVLGPQDWQKINRPQLPPGLRGRFPLLFKFLDSQQSLSVQVHPNDQQGSMLTPPDLGKTEAWYVMHAAPDAKIFAGLRAGVDRMKLLEAVELNQVDQVLHSFIPRVGDLIFIPAGTVHALGAGLVVAEIQQASNTTFRLHDWNRVDAHGNSRPLHIRESLDVIDFAGGPIHPHRLNGQGTWQQPFNTNTPTTTTTLHSLACDKFELRLQSIHQEIKLGGDGKLRLLANVQGELEIERDPAGGPLKFAETILLPACLPATKVKPLTPSARFLEIQLP
jgi:mannose-6-phosphate isomerase